MIGKNLSGLRSQLFKLAAPIFIEILLIMLLGATDIAMLSKHSDKTVAAVGVVNQLLNMIFLVFQVITLGTSVLCSQYLGAKQRENGIQTIGVSILFNLVIGIVISSILFIHAGEILVMMDLSPELVQEGLPYMHIVGGFAFLQGISLTLSAILRSYNMAIEPMKVTLLMNILNIIGNYTLIFGKFGMPELGVTGAAISTSSCRFVAMILLFITLFRKVERRYPLAYFRPFPFDKLKNILTIGLPSAGEEISYNLSQVVVTYFTVMLGTVALTTRAYSMNIVMFTYLFAAAIGQGGAICVGHLVGGGRNQAAYVLQRYCTRMAILISLCMSLFTLSIGYFVFGFLTENQDIVRIGMIILAIDVVLEIGRAVNILCVRSLNAVGDVRFPFFLGIVVMWSVATGLSYVLGIHWGWGLAGMWFAFLLDENIRAVILVRRWKSRKWEGKTFIQKSLKH